ncbi:MAG: MarR family winged helix-turn-helix transcriptional regulator, partial [Vulcanimicrobiaceae bacterium]
MSHDFFAVFGSAVRALRARLDRILQHHGLRLGQYQVLRVLWEHDGSTPGELAEQLDVEMPTVTRTVQRMVRDGLVQREAHRSDARSVRIRLTPLGTDKKTEVARLFSDEAELALAGF